MDQALEQPTNQAHQWLRAKCGEDSALFEQVRDLLVVDSHCFSVEEVAESGEPTQGQIGAYHLIRTLTASDDDSYFLARHTGRGDECVLKRYETQPDAAEQERLQQLAALNLPHLALPREVLTDDQGRWVTALPLVNGRPIDHAAQGLELAERLDLLTRICLALAPLHDLGIAHGNLACGAICVADQGTFAIGGFEEAPPTSGVVITPEGPRLILPDHISPERARGASITLRDDIYALGILAYKLLCGRAPYRLTGRPASEVRALLYERMPPAPSQIELAESPPQGWGSWDELIRVALAKDPLARFSDCGAMARACLGTTGP